MVFSSGSSAGSALMPKNFHQNTIPAHRDNMRMKADAMGYGHDRALLHIFFMQFLLLTKNLCDYHLSSGNRRQETGNGKRETGDRGKVAVLRLLICWALPNNKQAFRDMVWYLF